MVIRSPFTIAAVGIGVGEGGKGVLVGRIGVAVKVSAWPPPLHALTIKNKKNSITRTPLVGFLLFICVDYKRF
jgi:hypothetical protein